jgi:hypothetical protein
VILVRIVKYSVTILRIGGKEIMNIYCYFQVWNNKNNMNWAALLKLEVDSIFLGYIFESRGEE